MKSPAETKVISKSYLSGLIVKCGFLFTAGLILTGVILFFSAQQPLGPSYQESFTRLAQLKQEMLYKSILIYLVIMLVVMAGVVFITVHYSHRVVGPMIGLKRILGLIKNGDLTTPAVLRTKDAIKPMADALNDLMDSYKKTLKDLRSDVGELQSMTTKEINQPQCAVIRKKIHSITGTLANLKL